MFHQVDLLLFVQLQKYNFTVDDNTFIINFKRLKTNYPATKHFLNISQPIMSYLVEKLATLNATDFIFGVTIYNIRDSLLPWTTSFGNNTWHAVKGQCYFGVKYYGFPIVLFQLL